MRSLSQSVDMKPEAEIPNQLLLATSLPAPRQRSVVGPLTEHHEKNMKRISRYLWVPLVVLLSSCASVRVSSNHVWAIVKISYDPATLKAEGGSCGSAFFVDETTFVTTHHGAEMDSGVLKPNSGYPNVRVILVNSEGDTIDDFWITKRVPEYDLAIGRINKKDPAVRVCPIETQIAVGDEVYNIGYPTDQGVPDYSLRIDGHKLIVQSIHMTPSIQSGSVKAIKKATVHANDVNLEEKTVAILDYASRVGFSGGPLVSKRSGKVLGLMSFGIPKALDSKTPVVAIRMADIHSIIEKEGQQHAPPLPSEGAPSEGR
jgi:hypothetical protein